MSLDNSHQISDVKCMIVKGIDGSGIESIEKTGTSGLVDTYTITLTDGTSATFTVTNGRGISNIAKTSTVGLVDTYTITYNDGTTSTFTVTNANGEVDDAMSTSSTNALENRVITNKVNQMDENMAIVESGSTASATRYAGDLVLVGGVLYEVTDTIASGVAYTVGVNCEVASLGEKITGLSSSLAGLGEYVEIQATANETYKSALSRLWALVDFSKFKYSAVLANIATSTNYYKVQYVGSNAFSCASITNNGTSGVLVYKIEVYQNANSCRYLHCAGTTTTDKSSDATSGTWRLYYA